MVRRISTQQAQDNFNELISSVRETNEPVILEERGVPYVAVISNDELQEFLEFQKERDWARLDELARRNAAIDPDEAFEIVTCEVEAVRQERWENSFNDRGDAHRS